MRAIKICMKMSIYCFVALMLLKWCAVCGVLRRKDGVASSVERPNLELCFVESVFQDNC